MLTESQIREAIAKQQALKDELMASLQTHYIAWTGSEVMEDAVKGRHAYEEATASIVWCNAVLGTLKAVIEDTGPRPGCAPSGGKP